MSVNELGSGAGHGGGSGGSIREAGGPLGRIGAVREDEYFRQQQKEQLQNLRLKLESEAAQKKEDLEQHQKVLDQCQQQLNKIESGNKPQHH